MKLPITTSLVLVLIDILFKVECRNSKMAVSKNCLCDITLTDEECSKYKFKGMLVAPPQAAVTEVTIEHLTDLKMTVVSWNTTKKSWLGGYLVTFPLDPGWSKVVCKAVIFSSTNFQDSCKAKFDINNDMQPTVKPLLKNYKKKDMFDDVLIRCKNTSFLEILFMNSKKPPHTDRYKVELWNVKGNQVAQKKTDMNRVTFLDVNPEKYYAKIWLDNDGLSRCSCSLQVANLTICMKCEVWVTKPFNYPCYNTNGASDSVFTSVLAVLIVLIIVVASTTTIFFCNQTRRRNCVKRIMKRESSFQITIHIISATENRQHCKVVEVFREYLETLFKEKNHSAIINTSSGDDKKLKVADLIIVFVSEKLLKTRLFSKKTASMYGNKLLTIRISQETVSEVCKKMLSQYPTFELYKDIEKLTLYMASRISIKADLSSLLVNDKKHSLKVAIESLNDSSQQEIAQQSAKSESVKPQQKYQFPVKQPRISGKSHNIDSFSKVLHACDKGHLSVSTGNRLIGLQRTQDGLERIVLPGKFDFIESDVESMSEIQVGEQNNGNDDVTLEAISIGGYSV